MVVCNAGALDPPQVLPVGRLLAPGLRRRKSEPNSSAVGFPRYMVNGGSNGVQIGKVGFSCAKKNNINRNIFEHTNPRTAIHPCAKPFYKDVML